ncbi:MAG: ABC transporter ATP-binding protein [Anaerolineae bacterium]
MPAIVVENLAKRYGLIRALDGLSLEVPEGAVFGFLGPNGAGKTTTLRILTGLARATGGSAWVAGHAVGREGAAISRLCGYLPEEPAFYTYMTPTEFLGYIGGIYGLDAAERRARAAELLELVGLSEAAKRRIGGFSRGMRQRLGIAQALVQRPAVLLLDEPVSALDPIGRAEVLSLIERLRASCTILLSTHILADVERVCDTVAIIDRGKLLVQAPKDDLLARYALPLLELTCEPSPALEGWLSAVQARPWFAALDRRDHTLRFTVTDLEAARSELLPAALAAGLKPLSYQVARPTLEDVFIRLVQPGGEAVQ